MTVLLQFEGVTLERGGRRLFEAMDLNLGPGEGVAVTGPNGSGKSSLLRLAAGLLRHSSGKVHRSPLTLVDDRPALDRDRTLAEALRFWTGGDPLPAIEALGLDHLAQVPVRFLSAGQLRRASLARALGTRAPLWLLDEPANALDRDGADRLSAIIAAHRGSGGAVLAATHAPLPGDWRMVGLGR